MSEVTKLLAAVEKLKCEFNTLKDTTNEIQDYQLLTNNINSIQFIQAQLNDIIQKVDKLLLKKDLKDPVTGNNIYGSIYIQKVNSLNDIVVPFKVEVETILTTLISLQKSLPDITVTPFSPKIRQNNSNTTISEHLIIQAIKQQNMEENIIISPDDNQNSDELHQLAEESRLKRAKELEIKVNQMNQIIELLQYKIHVLNTKLSTGGLRVLPQVIDYISKRSPSSSFTTQMYRTVIDLLHNIISYPDKDQYRKLRINNPHIWNNITRYHGGLYLLLVIGFQLSLDPLPFPDPSHGFQTISALNQDLTRNVTLDSTIMTTELSSSSSSSSSSSETMKITTTTTTPVDDISYFNTILKTSYDPTTTSTTTATSTEYMSMTESQVLLQDIQKLYPTQPSYSKVILTMHEPNISDTNIWIIWYDSIQGMKAYLTEILSSTVS